MLYNIDEKLCGQDHGSNNNFLIHNTTTGTINAKCHSARCGDFCQTIYKNETSQLDIEDFDLFQILGVPKEIVLKWLQKSSNYKSNEELIEQKLNAIYQRDHKPSYDAINDAYYTIINFAKNDNPKAFYKYKLGVSEYERNILPMEVIDNYIANDQRGICELFSIMYGDRVKFVGTEKDNMVYYWNGDLWMEDKKNYISYLFMTQISNNLKAYQSYLANMMVTDTESVEIHEANLKTSQALYKSCNKARYLKECRNIFCYLMQ